MAELVNLERLPAVVRKRVEPYCEEMIRIHAENLESILVYGSSTGTDFIPGKSNINLLLMFNEVGLEDLKKSLKLVAKGRKKGIVAPLFLTRRHIETSTDVFPIEFLEIKENHVLVYGTDIFKGLQIKRENIRLQCEQQLKGKIIRLNQAYLEVGLKSKGVEEILVESLTALVPVFRNMLRLKGWAVVQEKEKILERVSTEFDVDKSVFFNIWKDKKGDEKIAGVAASVVLEQYLAQLRKLAIAVDKL